MFAQARGEHRPAFLPYFPVGYPTLDASLDLIEAMAHAGADGFEIGIPFSDPLADGAVIQSATQVALENGVTVKRCLEAVRNLRARGVQQPMLLMGYANPLYSYGVATFVRDAHLAGADGLIVPDLPPDEGEALAQVCAETGLAMVFFAAPTSDAARVARAASLATGFLYVVSLTGVTGERQQMADDLVPFLQRLGAQVGDLPITLGFGISQPAQVQHIAEYVDGFIVGSALVRAAAESPERAVALAHDLAQAGRTARKTHSA
jgi:tryptophan synthase alpha chain